MPRVQFRTTTALTSLEAKTIIEEGAKLFSYLTLNAAAKQYLTDHPKLAEAIKKW